MQSQRLIFTFMISMILIFTGSASSNIISKSQAQKTAENFLNVKGSTQSKSLKKQISYRVSKIEPFKDPNDNELLAHVVSVHPKGFLIISADPNTHPVIAYSFSQDWNSEMNNENTFYRILVQDLKSRKETSNKPTDQFVKKNYRMLNAENTEDRNFYQWPEQGSTETGGWIETTWIQGTPYKNFCPMDPVDSTRSVVGCIVTAMAQVVHYHKHIGSLRFDDEDQYITATRKIHIDQDSSIFSFPGFNRLNRYLETILLKFNRNEALNFEEKAALCFACGISIKMDYTGTFSSIPWADKGIVYSLKNKMDYHSADSQSDSKKLYDVLIENLMNGLPAIIFLYNHAIVADGYNTDGFFHLNFGWIAGNPDIITETWYRPNFLPGNYEKFEYGVLNIHPTDFAYHPKISSIDSILYLPCARIGEESGIKSFSLNNIGETPVVINDILISENFYISFPSTNSNHSFEPTVLQPGEALDLFIHFLPDTLGRFEGSLQVLASYAGQNKYLSVDLIGHGVLDWGTTISTEEIFGLWKKSDSPFYICKDVRIPSGEKLQIEPGTEIIFLGSYQFLIDNNAQLIAKGTKTDSIIFKALSTDGGWQGFRFVNSGSGNTLAYCVISNGHPSSSRAAIYASSSSLTITHSTIVKNKSKYYGGAVYFFKSSGMITHTRIEKNICTASSGAGAIRLYQSSPLISNVVICNNETKSGGIIYGYQSSPFLINITLTDNKTTIKGGAIFLDGGNHFNIKNSIIWDNDATLGSTLVCGRTSLSDTISFENSDIDTSSSNWLYFDNPSNIKRYIVWEEGNFCKDPLFTAPANNEFTLKLGSPCIDAGKALLEYDGEILISLQPWQYNGSAPDMGAYESGLPLTISEDQNYPEVFTLDQNYPNPFNPVTTITYQLPVSSDVEISIYNILGQKVMTLISERQQAGIYRMEWDASEFASGNYYYRIEAGEFQDVKKMIFIK